MWNYLYETDAGMLFYLLGDKVNTSATYRIANKTSRPLRDFVSDIANVMDCNELCIFSSEDDNVYGIETSDEKLFLDTGYELQVGFAEGIKKMITKRTISL
jgi:nucleoside-diphosphate-sugar epimerase